MKTHWKKLDNPDYLGAYSLLGTETEELTATIKSVGIEQVKSVQNPSGEPCRVAHLNGQKPLILNTTNSRMIEKIYGVPYIEDWVGKAITLYVAKIKVKGELIDALRIRDVKPVTKLIELQPYDPNWNKVLKAVKSGVSIEQIKTKYKITDLNEAKLKEELK